MNGSKAAGVKPSRETVAEAAAWITRLHGSGRTPELEAAFRSWLAADERHARTFEGMTEIWDSVPAASGPASRTSTTRGMPWIHRLPVRAAAVAIVCILLVLAIRWLWPIGSYVTEIGEQRIVNLQDGTRVSMNSGTRMVVTYVESERRVLLKEGEAFFEVAHDARAPFVVLSGDYRVTALGTSFAVRREGNRTSVTLVEGRVTVARLQQAPSVALAPGERVTLTVAEPPKVDTPRIETVTAWRRGEVILDDTLLRDAIAEMNRYDRRTIVVDDPAVADLAVSGIYRTGDNSGFADIVGRMYGLRVVEKESRIHLQPSSLSPH